MIEWDHDDRIKIWVEDHTTGDEVVVLEATNPADPFFVTTGEMSVGRWDHHSSSLDSLGSAAIRFGVKARGGSLVDMKQVFFDHFVIVGSGSNHAADYCSWSCDSGTFFSAGMTECAMCPPGAHDHDAVDVSMTTCADLAWTTHGALDDVCYAAAHGTGRGSRSPRYK